MGLGLVVYTEHLVCPNFLLVSAIHSNFIQGTRPRLCQIQPIGLGKAQENILKIIHREQRPGAWGQGNLSMMRNYFFFIPSHISV